MFSYATQRLFQKGFTLTELVLVMVIMGVLAIVAAPRFFDVQVYNSRASYNDVLSSLRYAQKLAVATGCEVQFSVNAAADTYSLFQRTPGAGENCNSVIAPWTTSIVNLASRDNSQTYNAISLGNGVTLTPTDFPIVFNALGQAINAGGAPDVSPTATLAVDGDLITIWAETGFAAGSRAY